MQILKGHLYGNPVRSVAFSPDGTRLASCGIDGRTFLWDPATGERRAVGGNYAHAVAFSPDAKVVAACRFTVMTLWDIEAEQSRVIKWLGTEFGGAFAFASDGRTLISVGLVIGIWDSDTGSPLPSTGFHRPEAGHATGCLALTPDRKTMATGHEKPHAVRLWDVESPALRDEIAGPTAVVSALALSPGGRYLAATAKSTLWVWEVPSKRVVVKHSIDRMYFKDVAFTPDGRFLVFARNDATVSLWDTTTWAETAAYDFGIGPMVSVACAPDGMRAAAGSAKGWIVVFDIDV